MTAEKDYLSVHIFYNTTDLRPILLDCIDPLVERLQRADLISRYFFIRYWEGGCHVRLRLLPGDGVTYGDLKAELEPPIQAFLDENPSLFDPDRDALRAQMRKLFEYEYGADEFIRQFGENGSIDVAENNSFRYVAYRPEFGRYGGIHGVELAEQHFHVSSDLALKALRDSNSHVWTSTLGLALQLMFHFAVVFFDTKEEQIDFFQRYATRWHDLSTSSNFIKRLDRLYQIQESQILAHFAQVERIHQNLSATENGVLGKWLRHAYWLRDQIARLSTNNLFDFNPPAVSHASAVRRLLVSYIHMMNNRLGVSILEEIYIAHLIIQGLSRENV
jgi:thiopeptide-type bacteriocin biosynthesis protein